MPSLSSKAVEGSRRAGGWNKGPLGRKGPATLRREQLGEIERICRDLAEHDRAMKKLHGELAGAIEACCGSRGGVSRLAEAFGVTDTTICNLRFQRRVPGEKFVRAVLERDRSADGGDDEQARFGFDGDEANGEE